MEEPITLVVVDCQYDFCHPAGTLYVKGAETAVENILHFISTTDNITEVILPLIGTKPRTIRLLRKAGRGRPIAYVSHKARRSTHASCKPAWSATYLFR